MKETLVCGAIFEGRYEIGAKLGEGGFGDVYKARQLTTGQPVAVKVMRVAANGSRGADGTRVARFLREARICATLHHPNIVRLLDCGEASDGSLYTVFAFVPGDTLAAVIEREGPLEPREAQHLMLQVLDAMACAHEEGVVHRDLKPGNIMVIPTGARRNALLLDLGIGAIIEPGSGLEPPRLTGTNDTLGTPGYAAPEQWRGIEPSPRADLFSWGMVFLECLTGRAVYGGTSAAEIFYQQLGPDPVPMPLALGDGPLRELLSKATSKDPRERDFTARELFHLLDRCDLRGLSRDALRGSNGRPEAGLEVPQIADRSPVDLGLPDLNGERTTSARARSGDRRPLTALCCRVVAKSLRPGRVDVERLDEALYALLGICSQMVRRHRGMVASLMGEVMLAHFGQPRAEEDDAQRAALTALAILGAARDHNGRLEQDGIYVDVCIGVHSGMVSPGLIDGIAGAGLVGAVPDVAVRLARQGQPGSVLVSADFRRLLRDAFEVEIAPALPSDGRGGGIETYRLRQQRDRESLELGPSAATGPMVGREQEIGLLLERWRRVRSGSGQAALVTGEAGIGKSRLVRELRARLVPEAHLFLEGRCAPDAQNSVLFPIVDLIERIAGLDQETEPARKIARLEAWLAEIGFPLADVMPLLAPLLSLPLAPAYAVLDVSPQRRKALTQSAIRSLFLAMAERCPVLLLVEDLHWADATTIELLGGLVKESSSAPAFIVMTARPEFSPAFATTGLLQLPLGRLEPAQIETMASGLVGNKTLARDVVDRIVSRTDGVPLFIEELTRTMLESAAVVEHGDRYVLSDSMAEGEIPGTLRALLASRLDRLERAKETAQLAAALGREFSVDVLAATSALGSEALREDLDKLVNAGLVLRKWRLKGPMAMFKHALVRDAAYESLSRASRQKIHARIADTLAQHFPDLVATRPDLLAHHFAAANRPADAAAYSQEAAARALDRSAYTEAIVHASNVVTWTRDLPLRDVVGLALAANGVLAQAMMATRGWADDAVKSAAERSAALLNELDHLSPHRIPPLWSLFAYHHTASHRPEARAVAEELVAVAGSLGDEGLQAAAATMLGIALHAEGNVPQARQALEKALRLYDPERDRDQGPRMGLDSLVLAQTLLAYLRWFSGDPQDAFDLIASALRWARTIGHVPSLAIGLLYGCQVYQHAGDKVTTAAMTGEILALAEKYGLPAYEGYAAIIHAWTRGDEQSAGALVGTLEAMGCKLCLSYYGSLLADNLEEHGSFEAAIARLDHCLKLCEENGEHYYQPELHRRRALLLLRRDAKNENARSDLERAIELGRRQEMYRTEALATLELVRRFGGDQRYRTRVNELRELHPGLREAEGQRVERGA